MSDERLETLKWHHLKVELDDREKQWPEGSSFEFDHDKKTVTWSFGEKTKSPGRLIWHLTDKDLSTPKPTDVAERIIQQANRLAKGED